MDKLTLKDIKEVFEHFTQPAEDFSVEVIASGHINRTYLISNQGQRYILQRLNTEVFKNLTVISENIRLVSEHLKTQGYPHKLLSPLPFSDGKYLYKSQWRIFEFIEDSQTFEKVSNSEQCFAAARFLGEFHSYLDGLDCTQIKDSIPGFLDFEKRMLDFRTALESATPERLKKAEPEIDFLREHESVPAAWKELSPLLPKRIIHADPKISNFLFDATSSREILALIDWDTLMCGTLLYDFGDMARSYTNLREEDDPQKGNNFSTENYKALKKGFLFHLEEILTSEEKENLDLAAKTVIYIQAVRFLTDYLNGDLYYRIKYPDQNLNRTKNQINLLSELIQS